MPEIDVHASAVAIKEAGVLIRGASGSGKSCLALALIAATHAAGAFSRLIGDDRIKLENRHGRLIARGHPRILGRIEQRGVGILRLPFLSAAVIRLVIHLVPDGEAPRHPDLCSAASTDDDLSDRRRDDAVLCCADWNFRGLNGLDLNGVRLPLLVLPDYSAATDLALAALQRFRFQNAAAERVRQINR